MSWHSGFRTEALKDRPVAVVDIGSNSVRLVAYDGLRRSPSPIFNEKVLCGLGKGLAISNRLNDSSMNRALAALRRFRALIRQMDVTETYAVATAAARDAENGKTFIKDAEEALGMEIDVLSGKEEARFAALGVISSIPRADGVVGDLGGGSLELIDISNGKLRDGVTLPLGVLRLIDVSGGSTKRAKAHIDEALSNSKLLPRLKDRTFYAVGGTWRNLARLHMAHTNYPLHILHEYVMSRRDAESISELVAGLSSSGLKNVKDVSKSRVDTLPFGALVLERLLQLGKAREVVSSVYGVREGLLFSRLSEKKAETDPLLASCWDFARRYARSPAHELELCDWTDQVFSSKSMKETPDQQRLRYAACLLADTGWRAHPDYRAERSLAMISQAAFVGVDHPGRAFLAMTIFFRYEGESPSDDLTSLISDKEIERAHLLSSMFRLAYILSAAMPGLLPKIGLRIDGKTLVLSLPRKLQDLMGERVEKRLSSLAFEMELTPKVEVG